MKFEDAAREMIVQNIAAIIGESLLGSRSVAEVMRHAEKFRPEAERVVAHLEQNPDMVKAMMRRAERLKREI